MTIKYSKKACEIQHAINRLSDRYQLSMVDYARIMDVIRTGKTRIVTRQSKRLSIHDVALDDRIIRVVYDRQRHCLVTALLDFGEYPPDQTLDRRLPPQNLPLTQVCRGCARYWVTDRWVAIGEKRLGKRVVEVQCPDCLANKKGDDNAD